MVSELAMAAHDCFNHHILRTIMEIDKAFLDTLFEQAKENVRLRQNYDLRTTAADGSQRMLNAMMPGTAVPVHRHDDTAETVICLRGKLDEVMYEEVACSGTDAERFREVKRVRLCPEEGKYGCQIPKGAWHSVDVIEPSVIFEAKDGAYKERR